MRWGVPCVSMALLFAEACGPPQAAEENGPSETPQWSECFAKDEVQTCAEACATAGMECAANGCPAEPEYCDPEPCDMATQAIASETQVFCSDPSVGGFVAGSCDQPIDWLFLINVRCCCA